jgi:hypothetical protein
MSMNFQEKALDVVSDLLKLIPSTAGVMLALIWGLASRDVEKDVLHAIQIASIVLVSSIVVAIFGLQFVTSRLEKSCTWVSKEGAVQLCFFLAWASFVAGCGLVIWSLYLL